MIRRSRTLVALLALVALSAFIAESAWALVCHPGMGACEAGMEMCPPEAQHEAPSPDGSGRAPSHAPVCPMAMASGGCAVVAMPAAAVAAQPEIVQSYPTLPSLDRTPDLLIVAVPFRPPRA